MGRGIELESPSTWSRSGSRGKTKETDKKGRKRKGKKVKGREKWKEWMMWREREGKEQRDFFAVGGPEGV